MSGQTKLVVLLLHQFHNPQLHHKILILDQKICSYYINNKISYKVIYYQLLIQSQLHLWFKYFCSTKYIQSFGEGLTKLVFGNHRAQI